MSLLNKQESLFADGLWLSSSEIAGTGDNNLKIGSALWRANFETEKRRYPTNSNTEV